MRKIALNEIISTLNSLKDVIKKEYKAEIVGVFGSYARGEQREISDVDVVVEFEKPIGLKFFELAEHLEEILGIKVDLLTTNALRQKPMLWENVKEDLVYV